MANPRTVRVTRKLIDWALTQSSTQCAISLALKDADDAFASPRVNQEKICITDRATGQRYIFKTPDRIAKWIDQFDRDPSTTKPLTFTLDLDEADEVRPIQRQQPSEIIARHQRYEQAGRVAQARGTNTKRPLRTT